MNYKYKKIYLVTGIFLITCIFYGYLATKMGNIVFYPGDEFRFLAIAKSLHFQHNISEHYQIMGYTDILYPFIISLTYFFYNPENILLLMRFIGIICMASVVFPVYLFAKEFNIGKIFKIDGSVLLVILSVIIPELTYTQYLSEEVLLYPLFMWMIYFAYVRIKSEKDTIKEDIVLVILFFLMYATKTFAIVFAIAYYGILFGYNILKKNKKDVVRTIICGIAFLVLVLLLKGGCYLLNGMNSGYSHYTEQALTIFPLSAQVFVGLARGFLFYTSYFILFTGIAPVIYLCANFKKYDKKDMLYGTFLLALILITIIEIVTIIHYSENGCDATVSRFHYRYLFYFFIPVMAFFLKYKGEIKERGISLGILAYVAINMMVFFVKVNGNMQGICDGLVLFMSKSMNVYNGFTDTLYIIIMVVLVIMAILCVDRKDNILWMISFLTVTTIAVITTIYSLNIPAKNSIKGNENDQYIRMSEIINEHNGKVVCLSNGDYADNIMRSTVYSQKDFYEIFIGKEDNTFEVEEDNTLIIVSNTFPYELKGDLQYVGDNNIRLYIASSGTVEVDHNSYNINFYSYGYLYDGYDEGGRRYLQRNGISFGPYIDLSAGVYKIEVLGNNLESSNMYSYSGDINFDEEVIETESEKVVLEIKIPSDVQNFEFSVRNVGESDVVVDGIKIVKIGEID